MVSLNDKDITIAEIRNQTGNCTYCEINDVDWFCAECWFGLCEDCLTKEDFDRCRGACYDKLPMLGDIYIFE